MAPGLARVVAATDFSEDAGKAARRAAIVAAQHGSELELLHVVSRSSLDAVREWVREPMNVADRLVEDARHVLRESAASLGAPASARIAVGDVLEEILSSCGEDRLLVVGARGLSPLRDAILGTTAERLIGRTECPVLVVRKTAGEPYRRALVAVDLLAGSENALGFAAAFAPGAKMAALHAYDVPYEGALQRAGVPSVEIDQHRAKALSAALERIGALSGRARLDPALFVPVVERADARRLILERQQSLSADLIVIGKRARSAAEALLLGSTARHVLPDAGCDVLVVPLKR